MEKIKSQHRLIHQLGGWSSYLLLVYSLATILVMALIGPPPETIADCFAMLSDNQLYGLLRLDLLTVFFMPLYFLLFYSLYQALVHINRELLRVSTILVFSGLILFLATPSVFSYLHLSNLYQSAATEVEQNQLLSAGQAILASDMWHGTGARIGGILMQSGALIISVIMLKGGVFNRFTAYTGIVTHGLDLLHILVGFFLPAIGNVMMAVAGPLYLLWFPLIGFRLFKLSRN